jgi:hypothetical protein
MSTTTRPVSAAELLVMPQRDEHGNDCRLLLIRGELKKLSPTGATRGLLLHARFTLAELFADLKQ